MVKVVVQELAVSIPRTLTQTSIIPGNDDLDELLTTAVSSQEQIQIPLDPAYETVSVQALLIGVPQTIALDPVVS